MFRKTVPIALAVSIALSIFGSGEKTSEKAITIRAWHFPDIVHSAAIVGRERGVNNTAFGDNVKVDWKVFNAGPSAIEALFADEKINE